MQEKKGISLIVLIITIIVMIILAGAVIITISNTGIIDMAQEATKATNLKQLKELVSVTWSGAYMKGARTDAEFEQALETAKQTGVLKGIDLSEYVVEISASGADVYYYPTQWQTSVTTIVDGVPIPKGFVASPYAGENKKNSGLVIYELQGNETAIPDTETHQQSLTGRNQFVWVPVDDFSTFVRKDFTNPPTYAVNTSYWDPTPETPLSPVSGYVEWWQQEVVAMYASIKEYGGFYIGRYETGSTSGVGPRMGQYPYTSVTNYNPAANSHPARTLYQSSSDATGVVSTLTYNVQWDRTLEWWLETNAKDINGNAINLTNSISYGNYKDRDIVVSELNEGAQVRNTDPNVQYVGKDTASLYPKVNTANSTSNAWLLTTGALKSSKINNIYDMAGNVQEQTCGWYGAMYQTFRGGDFMSTTQDNVPVAVRGYYTSSTINTDTAGFRISLYIK